ncbi:MAG: ATPase [Deltaproteobacteria bacterium]|nr:ATPase [Deltaproteobacteria bacterium]
MYLNFYGFKEEPFSFTPDPNFLYLSPTHKEALSAMTTVIRERLGTITITGEAGTGKTTLIYTLLKNLDKSIRTSFIFNPKLSFEDLLKSILRDLEIPVKETGLYALMQMLNLYLKERLPFDETFVIIIDEAQNMDMEVLEGINRIGKRETPASKLLQIILVGQPELEKNLDSPGLREFKKRIVMRSQISPLTQTETKGYIDHRLRIVGSASSRVFAPEAIELICKHSKGIPRVINQFCDHSFLAGFALSARQIDAKIVKDVMVDMAPIISSRRYFPFIKTVYLPFAFLGLVVLGVGFFYLINRDWSSRPLPKQPPAVKMESPPAKERADVSSVKVVPPAEPDWKVVKVKSGASLSTLAQQYYQSADRLFLDLLLEANPQITDANIIHVNDEIKVPRITEEMLLIPAGDRMYKIHLGTFNHPRFLKNFEHRDDLKGKKLQAIPRRVSPKETWYRIVAGNFANREEGIEVIRGLKGKGLLPAWAG